MSSCLPPTQLAPAMANCAPFNFRYLEGDWPLLLDAPDVSDILTKISNDANGTSITLHMNLLSLGKFFIYPELLEPHYAQRDTNEDHVEELVKEYLKLGLLRMEHPGVVIGLGDGWRQMRMDNNAKQVMICPSSPHLHRLRATPDGPIGQIIRGGHRTKAIAKLAKDNIEYSGNRYWLYHVLIPGMFSFTFIRGLVSLFLLF